MLTVIQNWVCSAHCIEALQQEEHTSHNSIQAENQMTTNVPNGGMIHIFQRQKYICISASQKYLFFKGIFKKSEKISQIFLGTFFQKIEGTLRGREIPWFKGMQKKSGNRLRGGSCHSVVFYSSTAPMSVCFLILFHLLVLGSRFFRNSGLGGVDRPKPGGKMHTHPVPKNSEKNQIWRRY